MDVLKLYMSVDVQVDTYMYMYRHITGHIGTHRKVLFIARRKVNYDYKSVQFYAKCNVTMCIGLE